MSVKRISGNFIYHSCNYIVNHPIKIAGSFLTAIILGISFYSAAKLLGRVHKQNPTNQGSKDKEEMSEGTNVKINQLEPENLNNISNLNSHESNPIELKHPVFNKEISNDPEKLKDFYKEINRIKPVRGKFTKLTSLENQKQHHQNAKLFLENSLPVIDSTPEFIYPPEMPIDLEVMEQVKLKYTTKSYDGRKKDEFKILDLNEEEENRKFIPLNNDIFKWEKTTGVTDDIKRDGKSEDLTEIIYVAASQFNGIEATWPVTHSPGEAKVYYIPDKTQGPQAQLAYSDQQVELINCAANLGLNFLVNVLCESTKHLCKHGYLLPEEEKARTLINHLKENGHKTEFVCFKSKPIDATRDIHLFLVSSPSLGRVSSFKKNFLKIQYLCALHSFRAQFDYSIKIAEKSKNPVILKATAVGMGAFNNHPLYVGRAFYQAATEFSELLAKNNVEVLFQVFDKGNGPDARAHYFVNLLGLNEK